jgi:hypothetical protein
MKTLARQRDKAEVLLRLRHVRANSERLWGRMTAHQMVCHLSDGFRMALGQKDVSRAPGFVPRAIIKWIALYTPARWPPGIRTRPEVDQTLGGTKPAAFELDVVDLEALIERFSTRPRNSDWPVHPIFGPMSGTAWLRWGYLHTDHHLRQFGA